MPPAGVIQFLTHKATDEEANGYLEGLAADFGNYSIEGAFGGAFSDRLRGRVSGRWETSDGYVEPGTAFDTQADGRDSNGANGYAVRGNLQIDATDNVLIDLTASYAKDDDVPTGVYVVTFVGIDPVTGLASLSRCNRSGNRRWTDGFSAHTHHRGWMASFHEPYAFCGDGRSVAGEQAALHGPRGRRLPPRRSQRELGGGVQLVSITNWMDMDKFYVEDAAGGLAFFPYNTINSYDQWSEELRLADSDGGFRWQVGAYYLDMTWDTFQSVQGAAILSGITGSPSDTQKQSTFGIVDSRNWSVFGQVEFDFAAGWTLVTGFRWSQDDKDLDLRRVFEDIPEGIAPTEVFNVASTTRASRTSPRSTTATGPRARRSTGNRPTMRCCISPTTVASRAATGRWIRSVP